MLCSFWLASKLDLRHRASLAHQPARIKGYHFFSFPLGNKLICLLRLALFQDLSSTWLPNMYYFTSQFYLPRSKTWVKIHSSEQWFMLGAGIEIDSMHPTMPLTWKYCWRYWATTLMLKVTVVTSECWSCWDLRRALVPMCEATMLHIYLLQAQKLVLSREIFYPSTDVVSFSMLLKSFRSVPANSIRV